MTETKKFDISNMYKCNLKTNPLWYPISDNQVKAMYNWEIITKIFSSTEITDLITFFSQWSFFWLNISQDQIEWIKNWKLSFTDIFRKQPNYFEKFTHILQIRDKNNSNENSLIQKINNYVSIIKSKITHNLKIQKN